MLFNIAKHPEAARMELGLEGKAFCPSCHKWHMDYMSQGRWLHLSSSDTWQTGLDFQSKLCIDCFWVLVTKGTMSCPFVWSFQITFAPLNKRVADICLFFTFIIGFVPKKMKVQTKGLYCMGKKANNLCLCGLVIFADLFAWMYPFAPLAI